MPPHHPKIHHRPLLKQCYINLYPTKDPYPLPSPPIQSSLTKYGTYIHHPSPFRYNFPPSYQKRKVHNKTLSINTVTTTDSTNYPLTISSWKDELDELKKTSNVTMQQLINENNTTMTNTLNKSMNETLKEFQSKLMKTVEELIAK